MAVRKALRTALAITIATSTMLVAAGCTVTPSGTPTPTQTASQTPTPTPTPMTDAEALAAFKTIAQTSSDKADKDGLTEVTTNSKYGKYTLVLDRKYNPDYQAAVKNADGTYELIYESDAFAPAAALGSLDLGAKVRFENGEFVVTQIIENDPYEYRYTVEGGLIIGESGASGNATWKSTLQYSVTDEGHAILDEALKTLAN